jgi:hypothetical protein
MVGGCFYCCIYPSNTIPFLPESSRERDLWGMDIWGEEEGLGGSWNVIKG